MPRELRPESLPAPTIRNDQTTRVWLIPLSGGEAQPLFREKLDVHAFAWSADSSTIYFSTTLPLAKDKEAANKKEWKDVKRWREEERGDLLLVIRIAAALRDTAALPPAHEPSADENRKDLPQPEIKACPTGDDDDQDEKLPLPISAVPISKSKFAINDIAPSPDGKSIAFTTESVSHRLEDPADIEVYMLPAKGGNTRQVTHNQALEAGLRWSPDSRSLYFSVHAAGGSLEGSYQDVQGRLYRMDPDSGRIDRIGTNFQGSFEDFEVLPGRDYPCARPEGHGRAALHDRPSQRGCSCQQAPGLPRHVCWAFRTQVRQWPAGPLFLD